MKENIIQDKSYAFSLRILKLHKYLIKNNKDSNIVSSQILKCGTSICANAEEAESGQSDKDFLSKISIAYKEARETRFWLSLLHDGDYLDTKLYNSIFKDCEELLKILAKIKITMNNKIMKQ